jgi:hypothetical protein
MTLAYIQDIVVGAVMRMEDVDLTKRISVVRAFGKLIWLQNDLIARHYVGTVENEVESKDENV